MTTINNFGNSEGSSENLNRTESSHSNNVGSASSIIPCFPASNGTDAHHCDTIYQIVPRHLILQRIVLLIFPKSEPGQLRSTKKLLKVCMPLLGKSKRILFEK
jgi:hypothetical protein